MKKPIELSDEKCRFWMERLLARAKKLGEEGEVPVSAIVLDAYGRCIGYGNNSREKSKDPLGHAELIALKQAVLLKESWRMNDCTLIVTLEPCPMCAGALVQARIGQVVFGASDKKRGALGSTINLSEHKSAHHKMIVKSGFLKEEISQELQEWFKKQRNH